MIDKPNRIIRYNADHQTGLTFTQVKSRIDDGLVNYDTSIPTKSVKGIIRDNFFTLFNFLVLILGLALLYVASPLKNMLFLLVALSNTLIGIFQEIHAKRTIDKLSIISSVKVNVVREGKNQQIDINHVVLDDIIILTQGNQVITDSIIKEGECDVNESLITGESDAIHKKVGDTLLSGSHVVSGKCVAKVEHIGKENYASKISQEAKYLKKVNSEIMSTFNKIVLIISFVILPVGILLLSNQINISGNTPQTAVINTVAAVVGMIPEGLILLTSTVLAVSVVRLSKYKVLVQELYCIESLARVDVLCLDKTGTITEGTMEVVDIITVENTDKNNLSRVISDLTAVLNDCNPTFNAIQQKFVGSIGKKVKKIYPFSSEKKWSGATFEDGNSYIMGAAEFILEEDTLTSVKKQLKQYLKDNRVITIAHTQQPIDNKMPKNMNVLGFILIKDRIRSTAKNTLDFFSSQDVDIKIISGDNVFTVASIAKSAGLKKAENFIDATTLKTDEEIKNSVEKYSVFGRVTPPQKKKIILALKEKGHTVAMTGDGVNDVLALKEADCSIAMASGSDAARNVSQLVLLNSDFSSMIKVVQEGRRSINNIQRSSSLFLVKTIYSTLLAIIFLFVNLHYPFIPIQMTLLSVITIGTPSFILALQPNSERVKGDFLLNILSSSVPGALTIVINIIIMMFIKIIFRIDHMEFSTICLILTGFTGLTLLYKVCFPLNFIRTSLLLVMCTVFAVSIVFFKDLFSLVKLSIPLILTLIVLMIISVSMFNMITKLFYGIQKRQSDH